MKFLAIARMRQLTVIFAFLVVLFVAGCSAIKTEQNDMDNNAQSINEQNTDETASAPNSGDEQLQYYEDQEKKVDPEQVPKEQKPLNLDPVESDTDTLSTAEKKEECATIQDSNSRAACEAQFE